MIIVAIADIHGIAEAIGSIADALKKADVVLVAGDLTNFGDETEAAQIINTIREYNKCVLAVAGNCDPAGVSGYLTAEEINLDDSPIVIDGVCFTGTGGSLSCRGKTPNETTESNLKKSLSDSAESITENMPLVLVTHHPAYGTNLDQITPGKHMGSKSIRKFIKESQPVLAFCGHIHEAVGTDQIGKTKIANPGPLKYGGYAYAQIGKQPEMLEIRGPNSVSNCPG